MAHETDGGLAVVVLGGGLRHDLGHNLEVLVGGQQGRADGHGLKGVGVLGGLVDHIVVLQAVHQMGGLDHQTLDPVFHGPVQGLTHVVDDLAVPALETVNDELGCESPAHRPVRKGQFHGLLNGADGQPAVVVIAGAEADDQQLVLADAVLIPGIV